MSGICLKDFDEVHKSPNRDELEGRLLSLTYRMDFERMTAAVVDTREGSQRGPFVLSNVPAAFVAHSQDSAASTRDPVVARLKATNKPFAYDQSTYVLGHATDLWEVQAPFGYKTGICVGVNGGTGLRFYLGMDRSRQLPSSEVACARLLADLHLLANYAQEVAMRVLLPRGEISVEIGDLSAREREVLAWAGNGKSAWETARILGIGQSTTNKHLDAAIKRLGCVNKTQAVAVALRHGLI
jgi:DNA-binding CsgD family transcriptional regulator